jgi:hypothetical protein
MATIEKIFCYLLLFNLILGQTDWQMQANQAGVLLLQVHPFPDSSTLLGTGTAPAACE